ncbi:MAG: hypothetical protein ACTSU5_16010 [Promethearchaeota archaeon]
MPLYFHNPPLPILAAGTEESIDVGGFKGLVSIDSEKNLFVETTMYHELGIGIPDEDVPDQLADFKMGAIAEYLEQDSELLGRALGNGFRSMQENQRLFLGVLTIEVNGFIESKIFDVEPDLLETLRDVHSRLRREHLFPELAVEEGNRVKFEFQGRGHRYIFPTGRTLPEILYNMAAHSGHVHGFLCNSGGAANFYISETTLGEGTGGVPKRDPENIEIMKYAIERGVVAPIGFFRFVFRDFGDITDWNLLQGHPHVRSMHNRYVEYEDKLSAEKVEQFTRADQVGSAGELSEDEVDQLKDFLSDFGAGDD